MPTFTVDGVDYPTLEDDLTLDEAGWFYDIAGVGVETLTEEGVGDSTKKLKALICLSIARAKPEVPHAEIEARIGKLKLTELENVMTDMGEQSPPSQSESAEPSESSGAVSSTGWGDFPDEADPPPTGSPPSDTSADSGPATSESLRRVS